MIKSVLNGVKYHQSNKSKNDDRITVLKKLDDKYNYDNINFPAGLDDVEQFEKDNNVSILFIILIVKMKLLEKK